uniref:DOMON domain-containing protein n=1 Tax=Heterorhabditis bacteriophora TaxID=37862 RepID=A0A1I7XSS8_HETBA
MPFDEGGFQFTIYMIPLTGQCVTTSPPNSWLVTTAVGIPEWATAGIALGGNNFCIKGNQSTQQVEVYYHIDLQGSKPTIPRIYHHTILDQRRNLEYSHSSTLYTYLENSCVVKDSRIQLCIPICNSNWQEKVITSALSSGHPSTVAESIKNSINTTGWAITVLKVNYRDPEAHINASVFADSSHSLYSSAKDSTQLMTSS